MNNRRVRKRSQLQEKRAANDIGGRTVAGSGAAKFSGGADVRKQGEVRVECKFTEKDHYDLKHADLVKIKGQALKGGLELPVMQIEFITAPTLQVAVISDLNRKDSALVQVRAKQKRMTKAGLTRFLLQARHFQMVFNDNDYYTVMRWEHFLEDLAAQEKEEEC